jgi:hypothetical protein
MLADRRTNIVADIDGLVGIAHEILLRPGRPDHTKLND